MKRIIRFLCLLGLLFLTNNYLYAQCKTSKRAKNRITSLNNRTDWETVTSKKIKINSGSSQAFDFEAEGGYYYSIHIILPKNVDEVKGVLSKNGNLVKKGSSVNHNEAAVEDYISSDGIYQIAFSYYGDGKACATLFIMKQKKR